MRLKMTTISLEEWEIYRRHLPLATAAGVFNTYRISQHSWYKLRDGKPVKQAVIDRLRDRFARLNVETTHATSQGLAS